jgi:hypothetical protein
MTISLNPFTMMPLNKQRKADNPEQSGGLSAFLGRDK